MSLTLDLPDEVVRRLTAEAERRGARVVDVIADLATQLPPAEAPVRRKLAFVEVGVSDTGITPHLDELLARTPSGSLAGAPDPLGPPGFGQD